MVENETSEIGRGQIMKRLVAHAKESGSDFQHNANSLEGPNNFKRPLRLQRMEAGKSFGSKVVGRS